MMPRKPKQKNEARHPNARWIGMTRKGEMAPPMRLAIQTRPCARARSTVGNQREMLDELLGYAPASPAPNRNRMGSSTT